MTALKIVLALVASILAVASVLVVAELFATTPTCQVGIAAALCLLTARETLATGLIATVGVGFGAWVAWQIYQRQEDARTREATRDLIAIGDAVCTDLLLMLHWAEGARKDPSIAVPATLGALAHGSLVEVAKIDAALSACISGHIVETESHKRLQAAVQAAHPLEALEKWVPRWISASEEYAARTELLATCINLACQRLDAGDTIKHPLVAGTDVAAIGQRHGATGNWTAYLKLIVSPRKEH